MRRLLRWIIFGLTTLIGIAASLYPLLSTLRPTAGLESDTQVSILLSLLVGVCLLVGVLEAQESVSSPKFVALLGILLSINAALRFVETAIPGPGGFSPVFFLVILVGYVFGGSFGFLMGALTIVVSALITGGIGPWLPYQMLTAGWVGLSAPLLRKLAGVLRIRQKRAELILLAGAGAVWGILYGLIMTFSTLPYVLGFTLSAATGDASLGDALSRLLGFYVTTSALWDLLRALGNVALLLAFGRPTLQALQRFHQRFIFRYQPLEAAP